MSRCAAIYRCTRCRVAAPGCGRRSCTYNQNLSYGFDAEIARQRNILPTPAEQYRNADGGYRYWDELTLEPPEGAMKATLKLFFQSTSWEYVQFLVLANRGQNAFLGEVGQNLLQAWLNTGMAGPQLMAKAEWMAAP